MDAFDDFDRDQAKSNFNLITLLVVHNRPSSITKTEILEAAYCIHVQICTKVKDIVNELDGDIDACVENIVLFGMNYVFQQIRSKKYKECDGGNSCGGSGFLDYMVRNSKGI